MKKGSFNKNRDSILRLSMIALGIIADAGLGFFASKLPLPLFLDTVEDYFASSSAYAKHKSILIVDDDPGYMNLINDWLKDRYRVSMASSGVSAITWLATNHTDLILLDYEMPLTDGPQVLEMIRSQPQTANIPVIFLTGKGDKEPSTVPRTK